MMSRAIFALILASVALFLAWRESNTEVHVDGEYDEEWKPVFDSFRRNLEENWERGGAAFVVYRDGRKVVDIWGGYADRESERLWKNDTLSVAFSCSKAVGSIVIADLIDKGRASYDDLVTKYWPEFGKHGKENVTIRWLIGHKAGLAYTDHPITFEMTRDVKRVEKVFEDQIPNWPPGTALGYHAVTHGWLVDALVRRLDDRHRT
ncbi:unnamed protein product, partial [Caenorhabditis bovis]